MDDYKIELKECENKLEQQLQMLNLHESSIALSSSNIYSTQIGNVSRDKIIDFLSAWKCLRKMNTKIVKSIEELKEIMGKLTEVKVMLNKYFSSHFENFNQKEKEIIESVKKYRIIDDFKYMAAMEQ